MPRTMRVKSSTGVYHVMVRGNEKKNIFSDDEDREKFISILEQKNPNNNWRIYAFCLMDNHVHLLIDEMNEELSQIMKIINTSYAYYYNHKYERTGHLFQDRYKSEPVETDAYLLAATRYIHRNPLKAGVINDLKSYRWSSFNSYLNTNEEYSRIIDRNRILEMFSNHSIISAQNLFIEFMEQETNEAFLDCSDNIEINNTISPDYIENYISRKGIMLKDLKSRQNREIRDNLIKTIKQQSDFSIREIADLLKLSKSTVHNVCKEQ